MSGWMDGQIFFQIAIPPTFFFPIFTKLGTRFLCATVHKTVEQVFKVLLLKFWT